MKKLTLPRLASAVLGALFFLAACIVLAVRLVPGKAFRPISAAAAVRTGLLCSSSPNWLATESVTAMLPEAVAEALRLVTAKVTWLS